MKNLKLKVCGLRESGNIRDVIGIGPDFTGFIFYNGSPRYAGERLDEELLRYIPSEIKKVGVFVDESIDSVFYIGEANHLDMIQLHGKEDAGYCDAIKQRGYGIIKSIMIGDGFKYRVMEPYIEHVDYFLFDTKGMLHGGSGMAFDWQLLNDYPFEVPFFLSGGLSLENIEQVVNIQSPFLTAIDVNSRFEISPGIKDIGKLRLLKEKLKQLKSSSYDY